MWVLKQSQWFTSGNLKYRYPLVKIGSLYQILSIEPDNTSEEVVEAKQAIARAEGR